MQLLEAMHTECLQGAPCKCCFLASPSRGFATWLQTAPVPAHRPGAPYLLSFPLVSPNSGLPSTPVFLVGLRPPNALHPPQIPPAPPHPRCLLSLRHTSPTHTASRPYLRAPAPASWAGPHAGSEGGTSGGGRNQPASSYGLVSGVSAVTCPKRAPASGECGLGDSSWELRELGRRGRLKFLSWAVHDVYSCTS